MSEPIDALAAASTRRPASKDRLLDLAAFGANPGNLRARIHVPECAAALRPLVVVLHGCTQTAGGYDARAGWSALADELGFMLLLPEQKRANNPNLCFNWFAPGDIVRDGGEARSIREMIATLVRDRGADPDRVFITGLSAGGAMTSVMLATYPEVFAGGAIIAGLPFGTARGVPQALDRMAGKGMPAAAELDALVRSASAHAGPWPTISVWQGTRDTTVHASNADAIIAQWRGIHGVSDTPDAVDMVDNYPRRTWHDTAHRPVIEHYDITGMGHGTPLKTTGEGRCGKAGPFMLDVGISSTRHIAAFWGLAAPQQTRTASMAQAEGLSEPAMSPATLPVPRVVRPERISGAAPKQGALVGTVRKIIEDALRAAGLMR